MGVIYTQFLIYAHFSIGIIYQNFNMFQKCFPMIHYATENMFGQNVTPLSSFIVTGAILHL
jgi:hypothetical protein